MLNKKQIRQNMDFYEKNAKDYADQVEWNKEIVKEIYKYNIKSFCLFCEKGSHILLAGCGTGRDLSIFQEKGYKCLGVDVSKGMLREAKRRVPDGNFKKLDIRNFDKLKQKFEAIYCESALTHISKKETEKVLKVFYLLLKSRGIIYVGVKIGKTEVIKKELFGDERFFSIYEKAEFEDVIKNAGFEVLWKKESKHTLPGFPRWLSLIGKKI